MCIIEDFYGVKIMERMPRKFSRACPCLADPRLIWVRPGMASSALIYAVTPSMNSLPESSKIEKIVQSFLFPSLVSPLNFSVEQKNLSFFRPAASVDLSGSSRPLTHLHSICTKFANLEEIDLKGDEEQEDEEENKTNLKVEQKEN